MASETAKGYWEDGIAKVLISEEQMRVKVSEFATSIEEEYVGQEVVLVGVLKGGFIFLSDLAQKLNRAHAIDFIKTSSYSGTGRSEIKKLQLDMTEDIKGKHVIIVEDCIDSGKTLTFIKQEFERRDCESVKLMVMVDKDVQRDENIVVPDWIGFKVPNVWIVGYGLDLDGRFRTLPFVAEVDPARYS